MYVFRFLDILEVLKDADADFPLGDMVQKLVISEERPWG